MLFQWIKSHPWSTIIFFKVYHAEFPLSRRDEIPWLFLTFPWLFQIKIKLYCKPETINGECRGTLPRKLSKLGSAVRMFRVDGSQGVVRGIKTMKSLRNYNELWYYFIKEGGSSPILGGHFAATLLILTGLISILEMAKNLFHATKILWLSLTLGTLWHFPWLFRIIPWLLEFYFKFPDFSSFSRFPGQWTPCLPWSTKNNNKRKYHTMRK